MLAGLEKTLEFGYIQALFDFLYVSFFMTITCSASFSYNLTYQGFQLLETKLHLKLMMETELQSLTSISLSAIVGAERTEGWAEVKDGRR